MAVSCPAFTLPFTHLSNTCIGKCMLHPVAKQCVRPVTISPVIEQTPEQGRSFNGSFADLIHNLKFLLLVLYLSNGM